MKVAQNDLIWYGRNFTKDNVTYLLNTTNCRDYFTNFSVDENELTTDIETAKNIIKEIYRKELKEYQEIVNKSLENL